MFNLTFNGDCTKNIYAAMQYAAQIDHLTSLHCTE